jgi:AcrR family transcriptional regulator
VPTERKPKRRTRERILETALALFNDHGEPNVTTQLIADELGISPGNLYYHFHSKDEIIEAIFADYEARIHEALAAPDLQVGRVEDIALYLHRLFGHIWAWRFIYRDPHELVARNRTVETHFRQILALKVRTAAQICQRLVSSGDMRPVPVGEIQTLAVNMTVLATHWLNFEFVRNPRQTLDESVLTRAAYQVMSLAAPYLEGRARALFDRLSQAQGADESGVAR